MWSFPHPLVLVQQGALWCMQTPPERLTLTLGLKGAGTLHWVPSNRSGGILKVSVQVVSFQVPMNLFIMYMSGSSISIFPIMMVVMMMFR